MSARRPSFKDVLARNIDNWAMLLFPLSYGVYAALTFA